jgi:hypothetical protein
VFSKRKRAALIGGATLALTSALAGTAQASGSFSWYMTAVGTGFTSRNWSTPNSGGHYIYVGQCWFVDQNSPAGFMQLSLKQLEPWYEPDRNAGAVNYPCGYTNSNYYAGPAWYTWNGQPSGTYYFEVTDRSSYLNINADNGYTSYP